MATRQELIDKRERLQSTIDDLEGLYDKIVASGLTQEYHFNDGQNMTKMIYRTPEQVKNAIDGLQLRINKITHQLTGRIFVLRDQNSRRY